MKCDDSGAVSTKGLSPVICALILPVRLNLAEELDVKSNLIFIFASFLLIGLMHLVSLFENMPIKVCLCCLESLSELYMEGC